MNHVFNVVAAFSADRLAWNSRVDVACDCWHTAYKNSFASLFYLKLLILKILYFGSLKFLAKLLTNCKHWSCGTLTPSSPNFKEKSMPLIVTTISLDGAYNWLKLVPGLTNEWCVLILPFMNVQFVYYISLEFLGVCVK